MNPTEFRQTVEALGRENKVPLRRVLEFIEDVGQRSLIELKNGGERQQQRFLYANYQMFRLSLMGPKAAAREAPLVPTADEYNKKVEILDNQ